jgi:hypothetical protein
MQNTCRINTENANNNAESHAECRVNAETLQKYRINAEHMQNQFRIDAE